MDSSTATSTTAAAAAATTTTTAHDASSVAANTKVQHVTKASSDKLLTKFAELDDPAPLPSVRSQIIRAPLRRKRPRRSPRALAACREIIINVSADKSFATKRRSGSLQADQWKFLLPSSAAPSGRKPLLRRIGIGLSEISSGDAVGIGHLLAALEKLAFVFFTCSLGTRTHYYGWTLLHGGAEYRGAGRGLVSSMLNLLTIIGYRLWDIFITVSMCFMVRTWLFAPFLFNPSGLE